MFCPRRRLAVLGVALLGQRRDGLGNGERALAHVEQQLLALSCATLGGLLHEDHEVALVELGRNSTSEAIVTQRARRPRRAQRRRSPRGPSGSRGSRAAGADTRGAAAPRIGSVRGPRRAGAGAGRAPQRARAVQRGGRRGRSRERVRQRAGAARCGPSTRCQREHGG